MAANKKAKLRLKRECENYREQPEEQVLWVFCLLVMIS
jgi:hypothetical protein